MNIVAKGATVLLLILCAVFLCIAQEKLRRVEQPSKYTHANTPVEVDVNIDDTKMVQRSARTGPDWLRRLSLDVINTSGKDIKSLFIDLILKEASPEAGKGPMSGTPGIVITLELAFAYPKTKIFMAGDRIKLKPPVNVVDHWSERARALGLEDIDKVYLEITRVFFTDGTVWSQGSSFKKDPESGKLIPIREHTPFGRLDESIHVLIPKFQSWDFFLVQDDSYGTLDAGGCGWVSFIPENRIGCSSILNDGCEELNNCDRYESFRFTTSIPPFEVFNMDSHLEENLHARR